ncbi:TlpA family protein disulfide reductase [Synoicihabitans lomoniglobus]|uniref:TlpA disulfide reductase family protein n=1 Tax=Synoicihabitans lomoniglobus TaxID=2909285 RepID=A0AAE9ZTG4_9BACT|nr:TlpA family protein disulfide reductase [Opitutaceae bacterium LMO-M01]WED63961.1 TlpA disulfide reductase family protein [Opitutaceae bacterium LMO-M01]
MRRLVPPFVSISILSLTVGCGQADSTAFADVSDKSAEELAATELPQLGEAPSWALRRLDGTELNSAELAGKIVVLDFWATWCGPCRQEIPGYVAMQRELEADGVVIVGVSLDQAGPSVVSDFAERFGINYPLVMGNQKIVGAFGGVEAIPTTFLIDRDGQVRYRKVGAMARSEFEPLVRSLL